MESDYQVMDPLDSNSYKRLKEDIRENGLAIPIDVDEYGNILDGHHRKKICDELGIPCEKTIHIGMNEEEKFDFALRVNMNRRHLTQAQLTDAVIKFRKAHPEFSDRAVAKETGVDHHTVKNALARMESDKADVERAIGKDRESSLDDEFATGEFPQLQKTIGMDGKLRPASAEKAKRQRQVIRDMIVENPEMNDHQVAQATGASDHTVASQRKKMRTIHNPSARDEKALHDPDIVRRLAENEKLTIPGAIREQRRDRLAEKQDADEDKGIKVIATPVNDVPGVMGYHLERAEDPDGESYPDSKGVEGGDIYNMDCLDYMRMLPDGSVDLIICDPPYFQVWGEFDFVWDSEAQYLEWIHKCLREFNRILRPRGTLMLWGTLAGEHVTLAKVITWIDENSLFKKKDGLIQKNTRGTGVQNNYMNCREDLLFYVKSDNYTFNVPYTDEISARVDLGANGKPRKNDFKRASNVWTDIAEASQSSIERSFHPTTKPLKACDRIVHTHSNEGDLVYIPFTGSGSEAVSCLKNNRLFIGTEINEEYFAKSIPRIKDLASRSGDAQEGCQAKDSESKL